MVEEREIYSSGTNTRDYGNCFLCRHISDLAYYFVLFRLLFVCRAYHEIYAWSEYQLISLTSIRVGKAVFGTYLNIHLYINYVVRCLEIKHPKTRSFGTML